jgi:LCP family protein required for cell wall assembly
MGSDQRHNDGGFRTDALLLVTINFDLNTVNLTSFPRDLYVYLPGRTMDRINTAQFKGGFNLTAETFEYNFGVRPDHYALIKFDGFMNLINTLGGINVQVAHQLTDQRDGYGNYTVYPGLVPMDGETTLWYVRARYTTSDFDRIKRHQEVLQAIFYRLLSFDLIEKIPELFEQFQYTIQTDMNLEDLLELIPLATIFAEGDRINHYVISRQHVTSWLTYSGAQVLLPNREAIQAIMKNALNIP